MKRSIRSILVGLSAFIVVAAALVVYWTLVCRFYPNPQDRASFGEMFGAANVLFAGLAFVALIYTLGLQIEQLRLNTKSLLADHERRRKELTLSSLQEKRHHLRQFSLFLDGICGSRQNLKNEHVDKLRSDKDLRAQLRDYIETCEGIGLAVNIELFDEELTYRLSGPVFTNLWNRVSLYILDFRHDWPSVGVDFEDMVKRFEIRSRQNYTSVGQLRHNPERT